MSADPSSEYADACPYDAGINWRGQHGSCSLPYNHEGSHHITWCWPYLTDNPYANTWEQA